jgi:hypothetical protein
MGEVTGTDVADRVPTCTHAGVRHMYAALDLATGQMFYRLRDRKRWQEFLGYSSRPGPGSR